MLKAKKLAFPQILANKLNVPCENYALTGGSNDRSLRKLIDTIEENCLVIFGYTSPDRTEFYYPDEGLFLGRDSDNFIQAGVQWTGMIDKDSKSSPMIHPFNDMYIEHILRQYDNIKYVYNCVNSLCSAYKARVMHLSMTSVTYSYMTKLDGFNSYLSWCKVNNFKQQPYLHYDQNAHNELAGLLWKHLGDTI